MAGSQNSFVIFMTCGSRLTLKWKCRDILWAQLERNSIFHLSTKADIFMCLCIATLKIVWYKFRPTPHIEVLKIYNEGNAFKITLILTYIMNTVYRTCRITFTLNYSHIKYRYIYTHRFTIYSTYNTIYIARHILLATSQSLTVNQ